MSADLTLTATPNRLPGLGGPAIDHARARGTTYRTQHRERLYGSGMLRGIAHAKHYKQRSNLLPVPDQPAGISSI